MKAHAWIGAALLLAACGRGPHPGFSEVAEGVHLQYHQLGDGEQTVQDEDSVLLRLRLAVVGDPPGSLLSTDAWFAGGDLRAGAFVPVMQRVHEGDSISLIAQAFRYPWEVLAPQGYIPPAGATEVRTELKLLTHRTAAVMAAEQERRRKADPEDFERRLIAAFIQRSGQEWEPWGTSLMHHRIDGPMNDTARVRAGDMVEVRWRGSRLEDGRVVDDLWDAPAPFTFRFGDTDQVVEGLAVAVSLLREGQEGEFILPAEQAFGARGVEGLVEPWTPMRYRVRLERIVRR